jgi:hypothetical protein
MPNKKKTTTNLAISNENAKPITKESAKAQIKGNNPSSNYMPFNMLNTGNWNPLGYGQPPAGSYQTWRKIRNDPTCQLALAITTTPIRSANFRYVAKDGTPKEALKLIEETFENIREYYIDYALNALVYGWSPAELIWDNVQGKWTVTAIKPLLHDTTSILVDASTGSFAGLLADDGKTELDTLYANVISNQTEYNDLYGKSRLESIREDWNAYIQLRNKEGAYYQLTSAAVFLLYYPEGTSRDASGAEVSNFDIAKAVIKDLRQGNAIALTNTVNPELAHLINSGVKPSELREWHIDLIETASESHGRAFSDAMSSKQRLFCRGILVPERAMTEGTHGTLAESSVHADVALSISDQTQKEIIRQTNWHLVNKILAVNGYEPNSVKIVPQPVSEDQRATLRKLFEMAAAPQNLDVFMNILDYDKIAEDLGIPTIGKDIAKQVADDVMQQKEDMQNQLRNNNNQEIGNSGEPDVRPKPKSE